MSSSAKLACVDPATVKLIWPKARDLIRKAVEKTGLSDFERIEAEVLSGNELLWLSINEGEIEAAATTQLVTIGDRKICIIVACAGYGDWPSLMADIEAFAVLEGCAATRIYGRSGWQRVLHEYLPISAVLEKDLAHGRNFLTNPIATVAKRPLGGRDADCERANGPAQSVDCRERA